MVAILAGIIVVAALSEVIAAFQHSERRRLERLERIHQRMPDFLEVRAIDGDRVLLAPFRFQRFSGESFTVPKGAVSDFASIPRLLWAWLPPHGQYERAAVVHDYLCTQRGHVELADGQPRHYSYREAADIFGEAMEVLGVWWPRRAAMVFAVKRFGPRF